MKRFFKIVAWLIGSFLFLIGLLFFYVRSVATIDEPIPPITPSVDEIQNEGGLLKLGKNWFRRSESGLYEMYVEGAAFERGNAIGKLSKDLIQYQEEVFNKQIHRLVKSDSYLNVLKYLVGWFNRHLDENVDEEYRQEIYGVSRAASHEFDDIAPAYQRMLNYHAAHDIGHALQNMSLVACTAFATWGSASADSTLIIGRNFDFYVGDDFAKNKIVAFYNPEKGHRFMMVTFGGMTGVLSGMNDQGLTVTLNAAKSEIPTASATPVSLVAREILQYAATIDEAMTIATRRKVFVSESFLIGSANDKRAAIIEKAPGAIDLYESGKDYIIGTNHFQSDLLGATDVNREHMKKSASVYRQQRVEQLLAKSKNTVFNTASILRNQLGKDDESIGFGNERAINQLIAHHAVIFQPEKKLVWVSTTPFQLGKFVCYDLNKVFSESATTNHEIAVKANEIAADPFMRSGDFKDAMKFNQYRFPFQSKNGMNADSLVAWNPKSYLSYMLAGDLYFDNKNFEKAKELYEQGLSKEIATEQERDHMQKRLENCIEKLRQ